MEKVLKFTRDAHTQDASIDELGVDTNAADKSVNNKKKKDWVGIIHRGCRVCIFRTIEAVVVFMFVSMFTLFVGSFLIPMLGFSVATNTGITQSTDLYTALTVWMLPMLFFILLITAAAFFIISKFLRWVHSYFSNKIVKGNVKDEEERAKNDAKQKAKKHK